MASADGDQVRTPATGGLPAAGVDKEAKLSFIRSTVYDVLAGCAAGVAITAVGHPLDTVKTRMQMSTEKAHGAMARTPSRPPYAAKSVMTFMQGILRKEGVMGFYRGASSPLALCVSAPRCCSAARP